MFLKVGKTDKNKVVLVVADHCSLLSLKMPGKAMLEPLF